MILQKMAFSWTFVVLACFVTFVVVFVSFYSYVSFVLFLVGFAFLVLFFLDVVMLIADVYVVYLLREVYGILDSLTKVYGMGVGKS